MTRTEALNLLREYAYCQSQLWSKTPEGQKYMALFNEAVDTIAAERDMTQYWHGRQQTNQGANRMPKFYRKQQVVEAFQWDGCVDNTLGFPDWMVEAVRTRTAWLTKSEDYGPEIFLNNGFVTFIARPGDWIVRDEEGHINRCHDYMFTKVYGYDDSRQDKQPDNNKILGNEMSKALERVINEQQVVIDALRKRADMSQQYAIRQTDTIEKACKLLQRFVYCDTSKEAMTDAKLFLSERGWCLMCESFLCEGHDYDG